MAKSLTLEQLEELRQGNGSFGSAIEALKQGYKVARTSWKKQHLAIYTRKLYKSDKLIQDENCIYIQFKDDDDFIGYFPKHDDIMSEDWATIEETVKEEQE